MTSHVVKVILRQTTEIEIRVHVESPGDNDDDLTRKIMCLQASSAAERALRNDPSIGSRRVLDSFQSTTEILPEYQLKACDIQAFKGSGFCSASCSLGSVMETKEKEPG